jgi:hypothetical protein
MFPDLLKYFTTMERTIIIPCQKSINVKMDAGLVKFGLQHPPDKENERLSTVQAAKKSGKK